MTGAKKIISVHVTELLGRADNSQGLASMRPASGPSMPANSSGTTFRAPWRLKLLRLRFSLSKRRTRDRARLSRNAYTARSDVLEQTPPGEQGAPTFSFDTTSAKAVSGKR